MFIRALSFFFIPGLVIAAAVYLLATPSVDNGPLRGFSLVALAKNGQAFGALGLSDSSFITSSWGATDLAHNTASLYSAARSTISDIAYSTLWQIDSRLAQTTAGGLPFPGALPLLAAMLALSAFACVKKRVRQERPLPRDRKRPENRRLT